MRLYNLKHPSEQVSFTEALTRGLGRDRGLFWPQQLTPLPNVEALLELPFAERSAHILSHLIGDELPLELLKALTQEAFNFPVPLKLITPNPSTITSPITYALDLACGPTLAFKDIGARFMAQCLTRLTQAQEDGASADERPLTILTATSGDTGAAVAQAFYGLEGVRVVVLYPKGGVSPLQEALFSTLGGNVLALAVEGDFDACQALVKAAFDDEGLMSAYRLNSANSINVSRLLAQVCYYAELSAQLPVEQRERVVVSVPSGNFGNLTAGLIAQAIGVPLGRFIIATNSNDTVPRYLESGCWAPAPTRATLSNAMDVSEPSNWPRVEALCRAQGYSLSALSVSEGETRAAMRALHAQGQLSDPHSAVAWAALERLRAEGEVGAYLCTAHPAKFKERVEEVLGVELPLPDALAQATARPSLARPLAPTLEALREALA